MNVERFIKKEAKEALKGNWVKAILAVFVIYLIPIVAFILSETGYSFLGESESVGEALQNNIIAFVFFVLFQVLAVASVLLLSPIFGGFVRVFSSLAVDKKADVSDLFYFFSSKQKYFEALKFLTNIIVRSVMILIIAESPALFTWVVASEDKVMFVLCIVFGILGFLGWILNMHRYICPVMLYFYYEEAPNISISEGSIIGRNSIFKMIKLSLSFIGWILLTIFVIPFIYVYPYMTCAYFVSSKYLIEKYVQTYDNDNLVYAGHHNDSADEDDDFFGDIYVYGDTEDDEDSEDTEASENTVNLSKENSDSTAEDEENSEFDRKPLTLRKESEEL